MAIFHSHATITRGFGVLPIRTSIIDTVCASMWQVPQLLSGVGGVTLSKDGTGDWIGRIVVLGISWRYLGISWVYCWTPWVCYWKWPCVACFPNYKIWVFHSCLYVYQRYYIWDHWWTEGAIKERTWGTHIPQKCSLSNGEPFGATTSFPTI